MALMATRTKVPLLLQHRVVKNGGAFGKVGAMRSSSTAVVESRPVGLGVLGLKDYEDYRRSLYGEITHKALLVDAAGTLLVPSQPMAQIYRTIGEKYGVKYSEDEILNRYRRAYGQPWGRSRLSSYSDMSWIYKHTSHLFKKAKIIEAVLWPKYCYCNNDLIWTLNAEINYVFETIKSA